MNTNPLKHVLTLEGLAKGWSGTVTLDAPLHTDRDMAVADSGIHKMKGIASVEDAKDLSDEQVEQILEQQVPALIKLYAIAKKLIVEVDIKGPNGAEIKDVDSFDRHPATAKCYQEIAAAYLSGFAPGKKKSRS